MMAVSSVTIALFALLASPVLADFDESFAMKMVNFAAASFNKAGTVNGTAAAKQCFEKSYPDGGFDTYHAFSTRPCASPEYGNDECAGFYTVSDKLQMVVVAFRGTIGKSQFKNEIKDSTQGYMLWPHNTIDMQAKVNPYFYNASNDLWQQFVGGLVSSNNYNGYKFVFTGHSLGGAMAALTAMRAVFVGHLLSSNVRLYTFGEPRIGTYQFAQLYQTHLPDTYRIVHYNDLVPHMPLCDGNVFGDSCKTDNSGAYHQATEIWYNTKDLLMNSGNFKLCNSTVGEDPHCSNGMNFWSFITNVVDGGRGQDIHLHYYNHKLDEYGPNGCNNAGAVGLSFLATTFALLSLLFFRSS